jgi:tetratricopeptide (TPR) repeat protein
MVPSNSGEMVMTAPRNRLYPGLLFLVSVFLLTGCGGQHSTLQSFLDTPRHHASNGFNFLNRGQVSDAEREFQSALRLDHSFSQAHCGLGLIAGIREDYPLAFQSMALARRYAKTDEDRAMFAVGEMRLYTMKKGKGWLDHVEVFFQDATKSVAESPEAYYYLGVAYKEAYRFQDAEKAFKKVLALNSRLFWQAKRESRVIRKVIKAMPESPVGKRIALRNAITRADVAALVVEELKLDRLYRELARHEKGFRLPRGLHAQSELPALPADVRTHPSRADIEIALQLGVHGLGCFPDGSFRPEQPVTRAEYAEIMGSILTIIRRDPTLSKRFSGKTSPFSDIRNSDPFYNAVMLCTVETAIMEPREGVFNPWGNISGADAVLSLRELKKALDIH